MAASLGSTRPVAKAVLPNRVGRLGHRLFESILTMKASLGIPLSPNVGCVLARGEIDLARTDKRAAVGERYAKAAKLQRPATVSEAVDARRTARGDECSLLPHTRPWLN